MKGMNGTVGDAHKEDLGSSSDVDVHMSDGVGDAVDVQGQGLKLWQIIRDAMNKE
jgi:hypothetical protein